LLPTFGIWVFGQSMLAQDRYLYLPTVGFALVVGCVWKLAVSKSRRIAGTAMVCLLASYVAGTAVQVTQWSSEEALYNRGLQIHPDSVVPKSGIAVIHMQKGEYSQAESMLRQLCAQNPADTELEWKLGMSLYLQKRFAEVIPIWQHVIANSLVSSYHDFFLSRAYFQVGDFEKGIAAMNDALSVTPEDTNLRLELANRYLDHGDPRAAIEQYKAVLARHPDEKILQDYLHRLEAIPAPSKPSSAH
jgi:tetratricopeptide (TPR) repeat protein